MGSHVRFDCRTISSLLYSWPSASLLQKFCRRSNCCLPLSVSRSCKLFGEFPRCAPQLWSAFAGLKGGGTICVRPPPRSPPTSAQPHHRFSIHTQHTHARVHGAVSFKSRELGSTEDDRSAWVVPQERTKRLGVVTEWSGDLRRSCSVWTFSPSAGRLSVARGADRRQFTIKYLNSHGVWLFLLKKTQCPQYVVGLPI